jgi:hypothetical protein
MEKKEYEWADLEIIRLEEADVITASGDGLDGPGLP